MVLTVFLFLQKINIVYIVALLYKEYKIFISYLFGKHSNPANVL